MHKKIYFGSLLIIAGIIGIWQLANAATTWQGPPTGCTYPGQTDCNTDGVVWNRSDANFNTVQAQTGNFKITGNGQIGKDFYIPDTKAFRIDKSGDSIIKIGNWGGTSEQYKVDLVVYGDLKVEQKGTMPAAPRVYTPWLCLNGDCRDVWPSGGGGGGTVTSVGSGNGLTGGPITGAGTLAVMTCANGQVLKTNASNLWYCGTDNDTNSGGTLTGITAGTGISVSGAAPSPTVSINSAYGFGCSNGQVRKWNGSSWVCSSDVTGTVGAGTGIIITGTAPNYTVNVDDNRYVNVAGDTMTGSLTVQQNIDGNLTNRFGYSGTLGNWLMNIQPAGNAINTMGTINHTGAINSTGNISITGTSRITSPQYCIGASCITAWPSGGGSGTVTSVGSGSGLTGGPITTAGTLSIAGSYALPQSCNSGWVAKSNGGSSWYCAADNVGTPTTPAGANQQVQFNNNGSFGGDADFTWDSTNNRLGIRSSAPLNSIDIGYGGGIWTRNNFNAVANKLDNSGLQVQGSLSGGTVYGQSILGSGTDEGAYIWRSRTYDGNNAVQFSATSKKNYIWYGLYTNGPADANYVGAWLGDYYGYRDVKLVTSNNSIEANGGATINGNVGIKTTSPDTSLHIAGGESSGLTYDGYMMVGSKTSYNMTFYPYHIQSRLNGGGAALYLNYYGGIVNIATGAGGGNIYLGSSSNASQVVYSKGAVVTSDVRFKKDISQLTEGLDSIMALIPVSYKYKAQDESDKFNIGFIAQQVETVLPDLVKMDPETGYYYVSYEGVIPVAVKAIQEQQVEIEDLKAKNQELEARLERLEALIK